MGGVIIESKNYSLLVKAGVPSGVIEKLKVNGIKVSPSMHDVMLMKPSGEVIGSAALSCSTNDLMKGVVGHSMKSQVLHELMTMLSAAGFAGPVGSVVDLGAENSPPVHVPTMPKVVVPVSNLMMLRDATDLYQQVRGTSSGAVYVVVAVSEGVRLAARIVDKKLSIRAESPHGLSPTEIAMLAPHGFKLNDAYASSHFTCDESASVEKTLGAVLVGCGLTFNTPLPNAKKVRGLSK